MNYIKRLFSKDTICLIALLTAYMLSIMARSAANHFEFLVRLFLAFGIIYAVIKLGCFESKNKTSKQFAREI